MIDEVPILVTTITRLFFVVEGEAADVHRVARAGAGSGQRLVDAEGPQAPVGLVERLGVGEVGQGDGPLGLPADDGPTTVVAALDAVALGRRSVDDERLGLRELGPGSLDRLGHLADQLPHALAGDGGDPVALEGDVGLGEVGARSHDQPRALEQVGLVAPQLVEEDPLLLGGRVRAPGARGRAGARAPAPARRGGGTGARARARRWRPR